MPEPILLHNTPKRSKELLAPITSDAVRLYTCGPTVYNYLTVGNWVAFIRWDTLVRTLQCAGYTVNRVMNITDVGHLTGENEGDADQGEDKLEKGARRDGTTAWEVAQRYTDDFINGMQQLNLLPPEHLSKATDYIAEQITLVEKLESKGYTYTISDGVYFDTSKFPTYADFARLDLEALQEGARVTANPDKRNANDFALWKFTPANVTRDMQWESPWGIGFPGWHIECSAMAMSLLGETIDIHTGGIDHIPVHHTNEIAQSEAASGKPFSHIWLHNAHLTVDGTKISKSLGNGYTLQDIEKKGYSALDLKMFVLQSHYRTESNFSWTNLDGAKNRLSGWRRVASARWTMAPPKEKWQTLALDAKQKLQDKVDGMVDEVMLSDMHKALRDDLDTPEALRIIDAQLAVMRMLVSSNRISPEGITRFFSTIDKALGLNIIKSTPNIPKAAQKLLDERQAQLDALSSKQSTDWSVSDAQRARLANEFNLGVSETNVDGRKRQTWYWL